MKITDILLLINHIELSWCYKVDECRLVLEIVLSTRITITEP